METYKSEFIEFMVRAGALSFGDFVTKSGRCTPYFINSGRYRSGGQMNRLTRAYAAAIRERIGRDFDLLFGPAYKGIPLAVGTAMTLASDFDHDVAYCFNRKEAKDHGEGGRLVGHAPRDGERVVIVEDVITAGTSIREAVPLLRAAAQVELAGLVVSVDRMERGTGAATALEELHQEFRMPCFAIVTIQEILVHLHGREVQGRIVLGDVERSRVVAYLDEYGPRQA